MSMGTKIPNPMLAVNMRVYDELPGELRNNVVLLRELYTPNQLKYLIGKCDFLIGARMHACIAALSQCVPAVGVAYSQKFKGVFGVLDADALVVDPRILTIDKALSECEKLFSERGKWGDHLRRKVPGVVDEVFGMMETIRV